MSQTSNDLVNRLIMDIREPLICATLDEDCVFVQLLRCYLPGQFQVAMDKLRQYARENDMKILRGHVTGPARLRLFKMRGWRFVSKHPVDNYINIIEYDL